MDKKDKNKDKNKDKDKRRNDILVYNLSGKDKRELGLAKAYYNLDSWRDLVLKSFKKLKKSDDDLMALLEGKGLPEEGSRKEKNKSGKDTETETEED